MGVCQFTVEGLLLLLAVTGQPGRRTSKDSKVDDYADKLIADHEQEDVQTGTYAAATGTYLPASIQGQDIQTAIKVLGGVRSRELREV
jgi:hypothetical protein